MILPSAVKAFMDDCRESYEWLKEQKESDLDDALRKFQFGAHTKLWVHQKVCTLLGIVNHDFPFFIDMGLGKSKLMLDLFSFHQRRVRQENGPPLKAIVLVPNIPNIEAWRDQINTHAPHLAAEYLYGSGLSRLNTIRESSADLFVINYAGLCSMVCSMQPVMIKKGKHAGKTKRKLMVDQSKLRDILATVNYCIFDESTAFKNHDTLTYKVCLKLARVSAHRYALTGTPFGRNQEDLWAQYNVLDFGATFGPTLGLFRAAYFTEKKNFWGGYKYTFRKDREHLFQKKLFGSSIRYNIGECLDLPPTVLNVVQVPMHEESAPYYAKVHKAAVDQEINRATIETHFTRLRQIASGFLKYRNPDGIDLHVNFENNPKMDAFIEKIEAMSGDSKAVIFHFFIESGAMIDKQLNKHRIKHTRIWSGTKDKAANLRKFLDDPACRCLVINEAIGSLGLNLQVANYLMFYESPLDPIRRQQAEARCRRPGQKKTVMIYDFIMQGTVEEKIYQFNQEGKNLLKNLLDKGELYRDETIIKTQAAPSSS